MSHLPHQSRPVEPEARHIKIQHVREANPSLAFEIVPPRSEDGIQEIIGLEALMQSLVLSARHPLALEIAGSATHKRFLVRATDQTALSHAEQQLRLRYPQADIRPLTEAHDPLRLAPNETVTVVELCPGAAEYLPMREWSAQVLQQQKGIDPLLGVLAALGAIPEGHRAIAQIALVPAAPTWSKAHQRKAIEHALEPERNARQEQLAERRRTDGEPSMAVLFPLGLLLVALFVSLSFTQTTPAWLVKTLVDLLLDGRLPQFTAEQSFQLFAGIAIALSTVISLLFAIKLLKQRFAKPVYDQRLVAGRTGRMAYRGRIRLYLVGPGASPEKRTLRKEQERVRRTALDSLVAAYRQFHTADAGHFVPRVLSAHKGVSLFYLSTNHQRIWLSLLFLTARLAVTWLKKVGHLMHWLLSPLSKKVPQVTGTLLLRVVRFVRRKSGVWQTLAHKRINGKMSAIVSCTRKPSPDTHIIRQKRATQVRQNALSLSILNRVSRLRSPVSLPNGLRAARRATLWGLTELMRFIKSVVPDRLALTNTPLPGWACGIERSNHFFTGDFLSSAWRLPGRADLVDLSGIAQKRARTLPFPPTLLSALHNEQGACIGECSHGGVTHRFVIPPDFFGNHTCLFGKSGEGKSQLLVHLVKAVIEEGQRGFFLLDPHGDLAEDVLRVIPEKRLDDVVLIDLGQADFCVGLNPLDVTLGRDRDLVVSSLISVFSHIWQSSWGPRMEAPFRAAILTLFEANTTIVRRDTLRGPDQQYTLLDVMQVLVDESFCHDLLEMTSDLFIHRFWYEYYSPLNLVQQRDRIDPVMTKMMQFESKIARRILGQSRSTIRLHEVVQQRKLVIVRLAFSEAGAQTGSLIGATLLGLLMVTLREQSRRVLEERARMVMFLDEFQSFGRGADLSQLLAELRKYGGSAVLATQSLEYLTVIDPSLLPTVQANTKQYFLFRLSATDATCIAPELDIVPADLVNLDTHTCYVRLVYAGQQQPTFSLCLHLPRLEPQEQLTLLRERCQSTYCLRAADIEQRLTLALGRALAASMSRQQARTNTTQDGETAPSQPGTADETRTTTNTPTSSEDVARNIPFAAKSKKRKKGQVTSFDRFPSDTQAPSPLNAAEEAETTDGEEHLQ